MVSCKQAQRAQLQAEQQWEAALCTGKASAEGVWAETPALPLSIMMASHLSSTMQYADGEAK